MQPDLIYCLFVQAESLRREIESALLDRDRAIKECTDLKTPQNPATLGKSRYITRILRLYLLNLNNCLWILSWIDYSLRIYTSSKFEIGH